MNQKGGKWIIGRDCPRKSCLAGGIRGNEALRPGEPSVSIQPHRFNAGIGPSGSQNVCEPGAMRWIKIMGTKSKSWMAMRILFQAV